MGMLSATRAALLGTIASTVTLNASATATSGTYSALLPQDVVRNLQCHVCRTPELTGSVGDSCCNYETVNTATIEHFHPLLDELRKLSFFRYFKVDLNRECPFWSVNNVCMNRDCSVCECPSEEIPSKWYAQDQAEKEQRESWHSSEPCDDQQGEGELSKVDRTNAAVGKSFLAWVDKKDPAENADHMVYINLLENPERFTGYAGLSAARVWKAIYSENCFVSQELCLEERVFYRLISGLQASISTHIALEFRMGNAWGLNTEMFVERVGKFPDRLQNLYFTYLFVLRAVGRYRDVLLHYDFETGNAADDARASTILKSLFDVDNHAYNASCRAPSDSRAVLFGFNETMLFSNSMENMFLNQNDLERQRRQFKQKFENISRIMDCVTCEKCRLWGKIQVLGLGTAIKILLADDVSTMPPLHRNEMIALINVLHRLSESVEGVTRFRQLEFENAITKLLQCIVGAITIVVVGILVQRRRKQPALSKQKPN
ncbi:hypothetical protein H310_05518 [Aphanomyces invadans]|uniref:Uncharacterized protein n=1 Tax=Aphanomyces invadans TaxID=157072 RepID=A0A024UB18_9STRA|nr:hypothetical protein H310_05518 [Aphanomyces invadans]ETW03092.1 hypothetical protein H310_05518 [Aphanomyces invadans]|eukprot:XP_008868476.1 hypothetical protein H310_05518 [Aphanomyces invadans]